MIKIRKGLELPITGAPDQIVSAEKKTKKVAILGDDYVGMKPTMLVKVGDKVKIGQPIFEDKKNPGVVFTSHVSGEVLELNRGARRVFQSLVVRVEGNESLDFKSYTENEIDGLSKDDVKSQLLSSGLWTSLRARPFSRVASPESTPADIFVTAIDSNPLAADPNIFINENLNLFRAGLQIVSKLTDGKVYVCKGPDTNIPTEGLASVQTEVFVGPHPAGNVGTHIHFLSPVHENKTVWHIGYQDLIAVVRLFLNGKLSLERVISLAGPQVKSPRLIRTIVGADISEIVDGEMKEGDNRIISGSVLSGRKATGPFAYLGKYHSQISVILEGREREFLGWHSPGVNKFSVKGVFLSRFFPSKKFPMSSTTHGSHRAMVPIGMYEKVMPLDIQPTFLLRSLVSGDTERSQQLGALELDEEDLSLCTFVDPGKVDFAAILRENLNTIEKDG